MANILIVDDDPAVQITIPLILERAGHRVTVAGDGHKPFRPEALLAAVDGCLAAARPEASDVSTGRR
ncbi:response regulator [Bradyrhizobium centrolobii]|uniref:response regulator n=1 Tax=Bradyrhizobium centrolobii TaxID=1505087 RepID=UPI0009EDF2AA|nr:response regulator [Bradyrhizobium centrolobii]